MAYSSMSVLDGYIDDKLKPSEIMNLKSLIFSIKKAHPNDIDGGMLMLINKLIK